MVLGAARQATTVRGTSECHFFVASLVLLPGLVASTIGGMSLFRSSFSPASRQALCSGLGICLSLPPDVLASAP